MSRIGGTKEDRKERKTLTNNRCQCDINGEGLTIDEVMQGLLDCSDCFDATASDELKKRLDDSIIRNEKDIIANVPAVKYVADSIVNYIFSDGLTTGEVESDKKLKDFVYSKNNNGDTNYEVLRTAVEKATLEGESGIRLYDGNLYCLSKEQYAPITYIKAGVKHILTYVCSKDLVPLPDIDLGLLEIKEYSAVINSIKNQNLIILDEKNSDFTVIKRDGKDVRCKSPFAYDRLRSQLATIIYQRLKDDVLNGSPGRLLFSVKGGIDGYENNEIGTSEIISKAAPAKEKRYAKAKTALMKLAHDIKHSNPDAVIMKPDSLILEDKLPRIIKSTEMLEWLNKDVRIVCQILGIDPSLVGMGQSQGNVGMDAVIDNGMLNSIIPLREKFATQFSPMLSKLLGVKKVYFNKYQTKQTETITDKVEKYVNMLYKLGITAGNIVSDVDSKESDGIFSELNNTMTIITELIQSSLTTDENKTKIKKIEEV